MFRGHEWGRVLEDFASQTILARGLVVEPKYNGWRVVLSKDERGRLLVFGEDFFRRRTEQRNYIHYWPGVRAELEKLPGPFVLDGEFMAFREDGPVPRRELAAFRSDNTIDDSSVRIQVFDALYLPGRGNLTRETTLSRRRALEQFLPRRSKHLVLVPAHLAHSATELRRAYDWARVQPGSEGAMLKSAEATYSLSGENDGWAKIKSSRLLLEIVYDKHPVKGSPGVWNYFGAVGPIPAGEKGDWDETVEIGGKIYVPAGKTFNTSVKAEVGQTLEVEVTEILLDRRRPNAWRLRHFTPTVTGIVSGPPFTIRDVEAILDHAELAKDSAFEPTVADSSFDLRRVLARSIRLHKAAGAPEEERFVLGIVLEPEVVDAQGDVYSVEEVRRAEHRFMEFYRHIGLQHRQLVDDRVAILESYLAPAEFEIDGEKVRAGTWLLAGRINDIEMWEKVKSGTYDGWSIGGDAIRELEVRSSDLT
jgi:hypothetical protein